MSPVFAASVHFHGVLAVIIILVVIAIIAMGIYSLLRLTGRGVKKVADSATHQGGPGS